MKRTALFTAALAALLLPAHGASYAGPVEEGRAAFARQDYAAALRNFTDATGKARPAGLYYRARMLELGLGVPSDRQLAADLYRQSADAGYAAALNRVALMFYRGENGLARDPERALGQFAKAEMQGDANATFNLGKLYFTGEGTARNLERALGLYRLAAERGNVLALNTMGALLRQGDPARSRSYYARSARFGNAVGLFESGLSYLHAGRKPENLRTAHKFFNLSAMRGHPKAAEALKELTAAMSPDDVAAAQADARNFRPMESTTDE